MASRTAEVCSRWWNAVAGVTRGRSARPSGGRRSSGSRRRCPVTCDGWRAVGWDETGRHQRPGRTRAECGSEVAHEQRARARLQMAAALLFGTLRPSRTMATKSPRRTPIGTSLPLPSGVRQTQRLSSALSSALTLAEPVAPRLSRDGSSVVSNGHITQVGDRGGGRATAAAHTAVVPGGELDSGAVVCRGVALDRRGGTERACRSGPSPPRTMVACTLAVTRCPASPADWSGERLGVG
jgi:hypothetical protein